MQQTAYGKCHFQVPAKVFFPPAKPTPGHFLKKFVIVIDGSVHGSKDKFQEAFGKGKIINTT